MGGDGPGSPPHSGDGCRCEKCDESSQQKDLELHDLWEGGWTTLGFEESVAWNVKQCSAHSVEGGDGLFTVSGSSVTPVEVTSKNCLAVAGPYSAAEREIITVRRVLNRKSRRTYAADLETPLAVWIRVVRLGRPLMRRTTSTRSAQRLGESCCTVCAVSIEAVLGVTQSQGGSLHLKFIVMFDPGTR